VSRVDARNPVACFEAPLEYWFFRVNAEGLAFLVDFIVRRRLGTAEVRVSYWLNGPGQVVRATVPLASARLDGEQVVMGGSSLSVGRSAGAVPGVSWDLGLEVGPSFLDPRKPWLRWLRPLDMDLVSWPRARIQGQVRVGDQVVRIGPTPALLTHYWGRRLPSRWRWISANQFAGEPDCAVEAMVLSSRLWALPRPEIRVGYFLLERGGARHLVVAPLDGTIRAEETPTGLTLTVRPFVGAPTGISVTAAAGTYNDIGDGIRQTLLATCTLAGQNGPSSMCGLERRD
jgi:hypothetical protein